MESIHTANYWMQSVHVTGIDTICNLIKTEQIYPLSCHKGTEGGVEVKLYSFTTSALEATTRPLCRPKKKNKNSTYCTGSWVDPGAVRTDAENLAPHRGSNPRSSSPLQVATPTTLTWPPYYNGIAFYSTDLLELGMCMLRQIANIGNDCSIVAKTSKRGDDKKLQRYIRQFYILNLYSSK